MLDIQAHDIVQIIDEQHAWYPCLLVVTEVRSWGVQAFACIPKSNDGSTPTAQAFLRPRWEQITRVGRAEVVPAPYEEEDSQGG